jgi:hypothetical protein
MCYHNGQQPASASALKAASDFVVPRASNPGHREWSEAISRNADTM